MKYQLIILFFLVFNWQTIAQTSSAIGGEFIIDKSEACLSDIERSNIKVAINESRQKLVDEGILPQVKSSSAIVALEWPMQKSANSTMFDYYGVSYFVDHDPLATGADYGASNEDYNCGFRSYDSNNGYNHRGTDYFTWPFPWYQYENDLAEVIAAAAGTIIYKNDGNFDANCSCSGTWNAVYIEHADGSETWYGHLKTGSLTTKAIGQSVSQGEYLGVIASSGCSTGPHLHFEVYDAGGNLIDPYSGPCNSMNTVSWWANQPAYREPSINALFTHDADPVHGCPDTDEETNFSNTFTPGQIAYFATYYHDQLNNDVTDFRIRRPDNSIWQSWSHTSPNTYNASWWYWSYILPSSGPFGTWTFEVEYYGNTYTHNFQLTDPNCTSPVSNTWIGPNIGNWNADVTNWSKGQIPTPCDDVIIPAGKTVNILNSKTGVCNTIDVKAGAVLNVPVSASLEVQCP